MKSLINEKDVLNKINDRKKIGIAVSGGMDSVALLYSLHEIFKDKKEYELAILNVNHQIRDESENESEFVKKLGKELKLPVYYKKLDVLSYAKESGESIELSARILRYEFFYSLINLSKVELIATAHHLDDQCETILMRILRGTGVRGLQGIQEKDNIIRPLLSIQRKDIENYINDNNLKYVLDKSNFESVYTRNFIRNELMNLIEKRYPQYRNSLLNLKNNAVEINEYLEKNYIKPIFCNESLVKINIENVKNYEIELKGSIVKAYEYLSIFKDIEKKHLDILCKFIKNGKNASLDMPFFTKIYLEGNYLCIEKCNVQRQNNILENIQNIFNYIIKCKNYEKLSNTLNTNEFSNKINSIHELNLSFLTNPDELKILLNEYKNSNIKNDYESFLNRKFSLSFFDINKIPQNFEIRYKQKGDFFQAYNGKNMLLSDYFTNNKIPIRLRDKLPLLTIGNKILMILGYNISSDLAVNDNDCLCAFRLELNLIDRK